MSPLQIAASDALKTQLFETGEILVHMDYPDGRVDQYVDAIRYLGSEIGLSSEDLIMTMWSDQRIRVTVYYERNLHE